MTIVVLECCFDVFENNLPFKIAIKPVARKKKCGSLLIVETFQPLF